MNDLSVFLFLIFCIEVWVLCNVLISALQQSESATCIHISPFPWISFPFRSPRSIKYRVLCAIQWSEVKVKVAQSCLTLCNPMDYIVCGILQARILEWVAFPFCRGSSQPRDQTQVSCIAGGSLPAEPQGKPMLYSRFSLVIYFIHSGIYMSVPISPHLGIHTYILYVCVSISALQVSSAI